MKFQADTHGNARNFCGTQNLARGLWLHPVFVGHGKRPHALDPGIHDQVGGGFAALGVGIVHMVVKSQLVPAFGHFWQMVAGKHAPHHAGGSLHSAPEIVGQLELFKLVAVGAHHAFHDLHERACRVAPQGRMRAVEHFVVQGF